MYSQSVTPNTSLASAQAAEILSIPVCRDERLLEAPFHDNLDYLQALEQEAKLVLLRALSRRGTEWCNKPEYVQALSLTGIAAHEATLEKLNKSLSETEHRNHLRAKASEKAGINLLFPKLCADYKIAGFNKSLILLLFMVVTSEKFKQMLILCGYENNSEKLEGIKIGKVLSILCSDYREQLSCRKHFSVTAPLLQQEILHIPENYNETSSILDTSVCLHERYVRYIMGDDNLYDSGLRFIRYDRGSVRLEQVIIQKETKQAIVTHVGNYLGCRENDLASKLDEFFGYGTALVMLFHGPSGTGKTMMAQALAYQFNRPLFSLKWGQLEERFWDYEEIIKNIFREASLNCGIVFFDEADDLFVKDSSFARSLLIQIEKARCIVMLATNKAVDLDPAMERRLAMKVYFQLPDLELRYRMWQALMPKFVTLAPDVNLQTLAERYVFSGGLIKNSIFMAINASLINGNNGDAVITMKLLVQSASSQAMQMVDMNKICRTYTPAHPINDLQINLHQRDQLKNVTLAYDHLQKEGLGLNILITAKDLPTGIQAAEALAAECNLKVKAFDYRAVMRTTENAKIFNPITQEEVSPMDYAFDAGLGDAAMILFVDYDGLVTFMAKKKGEDERLEKMYMTLDADFMHHLRSFQGLFCMVTPLPLQNTLPAEFSLHFNLEYPSEEKQLQCWEAHLSGTKIAQDELVSLIEKHPMHIAEIDFIARQALVKAIIQRKESKLSLDEIRTVISCYQPNRYVSPLFGSDKKHVRRSNASAGF